VPAEERVATANAFRLYHAAAVAMPSSRTATLVTPLPAASTATPMGEVDPVMWTTGRRP
jgi:hypothetical protein